MFTHSDNRPTGTPTGHACHPIGRTATDAGTWDQVKALYEAIDRAGCELAHRAYSEGLAHLRVGDDARANVAFSFARYYAKTAF